MSTTVVTPFIKRLDLIKERLPIYASRIIIEHAEVILGIMKQDQLGYGMDSFGKLLIHPTKRSGGHKAGKRIGHYEHITGNYWAKINPPVEDKPYNGLYNMNWTGELFQSLQIKGNVNKEEFTIFSSTGKIKKLEKIYETKLGDLTEEHNDLINETILLPELYKILLEEMFIGLL